MFFNLSIFHTSRESDHNLTRKLWSNEEWNLFVAQVIGANKNVLMLQEFLAAKIFNTVGEISSKARFEQRGIRRIDTDPYLKEFLPSHQKFYANLRFPEQVHVNTIRHQILDVDAECRIGHA